MLVLLPPSETKAHGGDGPALDLDQLSFPRLNALRSTLLDALVMLAGDHDASVVALGLGAQQAAEVGRNTEVRTSATCPALDRYTGVLYDTLGSSAFTRAQRARATSRLAIGSALFGLLRAGDLIPRYRLSAGSTLPGLSGLGALWRPVLTPELGRIQELVVDLRSGAYAALGPIPGAVTARVLTEKSDGTRAVVSHFNKAHKGRLARALALTRAEPTDTRAVARVARKAGLRVEVSQATEITVLT